VPLSDAGSVAGDFSMCLVPPSPTLSVLLTTPPIAPAALLKSSNARRNTGWTASGLLLALNATAAMIYHGLEKAGNICREMINDQSRERI